MNEMLPHEVDTCQDNFVSNRKHGSCEVLRAAEIYGGLRDSDLAIRVRTRRGCSLVE